MFKNTLCVCTCVFACILDLKKDKRRKHYNCVRVEWDLFLCLVAWPVKRLMGLLMNKGLFCILGLLLHFVVALGEEMGSYGGNYF